MKIASRLFCFILIFTMFFNITFEQKAKAEVVTLLGISAVVALAVACGVVFESGQTANVTKWASNIYNDTSSKISQWAQTVATTQDLINFGVSYGTIVAQDAWNEMVNKTSSAPVNSDGTVNLLPTVAVNYFEDLIIRPSSVIIATNMEGIKSNNLDNGINMVGKTFFTTGTVTSYSADLDKVVWNLYKLGVLSSTITFYKLKNMPCYFTLAQSTATSIIYPTASYFQQSGTATSSNLGNIPFVASATTPVTATDKAPVTYITNNTYNPAVDTVKVATGVGNYVGATPATVVNAVDPATIPTPTIAPTPTTIDYTNPLNAILSILASLASAIFIPIVLAITNAVNSIGQMFNTLTIAVNALANAIFTPIVSAVTSAVNSIRDMFLALTTAIMTGVGSIVDNIGNLAGSISTSINTAITNMLIALGELLASLLKAMTLSITTSLSDILAAIQSLIGTAVIDFVTPFNDFKFSIDNKFMPYFNNFKGTLKTLSYTPFEFEDLKAVLFGEEYVVVKLSLINQYLPTVRGWFASIFWIFYSFYVYDRIYFLVRGTHTLNMSIATSNISASNYAERQSKKVGL